MFGTFPNPTSQRNDVAPILGQNGAASETDLPGSSQGMGRRQDADMFETYFSENSDAVFQDMDLNNMMSWILSPSLERS